MFSNKIEALEYYELEVDDEIEFEFSDSTALKILSNFHAHHGINWWEDDPKNIESAIFQAKQQLGYMHKDVKHIMYDDYGEVMKEQYDNQDEDFYEEYPTYEDWEETEDFYNELSFIQEIEWNDFKENYENELDEIGSFRDEHHLLSQLSDIEDELGGILTKLQEIKEQTMKKTIEECFDVL